MNNVIVYIFSDAEKQKLFDSLICLSHPSIDIEESLFQLRKLELLLPEKLLRKLDNFKRSIQSPGVVYLQNSPIDEDLPITPVDARNSKEKKTFVSENFLVLISQLIGEPIGYNLEKEGAIIHDMCPVKKNTNTISNEGASVDQKFHVEHAYIGEADMSFEIKQFSPDYFTMLCLKQDAGKMAETWYLHIRDILQTMSHDDIILLKQAFFQFNTPFSFTGDNQKVSLPTSILDGNNFCPNFYCDFGNGITGTTKEAQAVVGKLYDRMYSSDAIIKMKFKPGDMLIANNRKGTHCRTKFDPDFTSDDRRWIQRVYIKNSLYDFNNILNNTEEVQRVF